MASTGRFSPIAMELVRVPDSMQRARPTSHQRSFERLGTLPKNWGAFNGSSSHSVGDAGALIVDAAVFVSIRKKPAINCISTELGRVGFKFPLVRADAS